MEYLSNIEANTWILRLLALSSRQVLSYYWLSNLEIFAHVWCTYKWHPISIFWLLYAFYCWKITDEYLSVWQLFISYFFSSSFLVLIISKYTRYSKEIKMSSSKPAWRCRKLWIWNYGGTLCFITNELVTNSSCLVFHEIGLVGCLFTCICMYV